MKAFADASGNSGMIFIFVSGLTIAGALDKASTLSLSSAVLLLLAASSAAAPAGVDDDVAGGLSPSVDAIGEGGLSSAAGGGPLSVTFLMKH